jgi:hypothetical protein
MALESPQLVCYCGSAGNPPAPHTTKEIRCRMGSFRQNAPRRRRLPAPPPTPGKPRNPPRPVLYELASFREFVFGRLRRTSPLMPLRAQLASFRQPLPATPAGSYTPNGLGGPAADWLRSVKPGHGPARPSSAPAIGFVPPPAAPCANGLSAARHNSHRM